MPGDAVDADTLLIETRSPWIDHIPAARHPLALRMEDDDDGYTRLTAPDGGRIHRAEVHTSTRRHPQGSTTEPSAKRAATRGPLR